MLDCRRDGAWYRERRGAQRADDGSTHSGTHSPGAAVRRGARESMAIAASAGTEWFRKSAPSPGAASRQLSLYKLALVRQTRLHRIERANPR